MHHDANPLSDLRTLIFDFGNVIIDIDIAGTLARIQAMTGAEESFDLKYGKPDFFRKYEVGQISEELFINSFIDACPTQVQARDILDVWNSMLLGIPVHRLELLIELRKHYRVLLLSNTNLTHIKWVRSYMKDTYGVLDFEDTFFDRVYYSYEVGLRKPGAEIYQHVLADLPHSGDQALFFDDTEVNVLASNRCGLLATYHSPSDEIEDHIRRLEIL